MMGTISKTLVVGKTWPTTSLAVAFRLANDNPRCALDHFARVSEPNGGASDKTHFVPALVAFARHSSHAARSRQLPTGGRPAQSQVVD